MNHRLACLLTEDKCHGQLVTFIESLGGDGYNIDDFLTCSPPEGTMELVECMYFQLCNVLTH